MPEKACTAIDLKSFYVSVAEPLNHGRDTFTATTIKGNVGVNL